MILHVGMSNLAGRSGREPIGANRVEVDSYLL